jgi:hypothetical protein
MSSFKVIACIDKLLESQSRCRLTSIQQLVVRAAWEDHTYDEIAQIDSSYSAVSLRGAASKLWPELSELLEEDVTKRTFEDVIRRSGLLDGRSAGAEANSKARDLRSEAQTRFFGIEIPDNFAFYGREREMYELSRLLESNRCVIVTGIAGIGKRRLVWNTIRQMGVPYGKILWQPVSAGRSDLDLARDLLSCLQPTELYSPEESIYRLMHQLRGEPHLIVLERVDLLLQAAGSISPSVLGFLTKLIEETKTGLVVMSQFPIREIEAFDLSGFGTRVYPCEGLSMEACCKVLAEYSLGDRHLWEDLIASTGRHPLLLRQLASWSQNQMNGSLALFERLTQQMNAIVPLYDKLFSDLRYLSMSDRAILQLIASMQESEVNRDFLLKRTGASLFQLERLIQSALVDLTESGSKGEFLVSITPLLKKYILSDPCGLVSNPISR